MPLQHFGNLEPCNCGAYRYLAARTHKKSIEIVLIHQTPGGARKYLKVAGFKNTALDYHDPRNRVPGNGGSLPQDPLRLEGRFVIVIASSPSSDKSVPDGRKSAEEVGVSAPEEAVPEEA